MKTEHRASAPSIVRTRAASPSRWRRPDRLDPGLARESYTAGVLCAEGPEAYPGSSTRGASPRPLRPGGARGRGASSASRGPRRSISSTAVLRRHRAHARRRSAAELCGRTHARRGSMDLRFFHRLGASLLDRRPLRPGIRRGLVGTFGPAGCGRAGGALEADHRLGQQRDVSTSTCAIINARRRRRQARRGRQRRRRSPSRPDRPRRAPPGNRRRARWAMGRRARGQGGLDASSSATRRALEDYMALARRYTLADAAESAASTERRGGSSPSGTDDLPRGDHLGKGLERNRTAAAHPRDSSPSPPRRSSAAGRGLINGAGFAFPKTPARLARPDLVPPARVWLNTSTSRHLTDATLARRSRRSSSTTTTARLHPDQNRLPAASSARTVFVVGRRGDDGQPRLRGLRAAACSHFEHADLFAAYGTHCSSAPTG